ncbi:hypothetical protein MTO96_027334 [Rhipicephalus appendiculatus]
MTKSPPARKRAQPQRAATARLIACDDDTNPGTKTKGCCESSSKDSASSTPNFPAPSTLYQESLDTALTSGTKKQGHHREEHAANGRGHNQGGRHHHFSSPPA